MFRVSEHWSPGPLTEFFDTPVGIEESQTASVTLEGNVMHVIQWRCKAGRLIVGTVDFNIPVSFEPLVSSHHPVLPVHSPSFHSLP